MRRTLRRFTQSVVTLGCLVVAAAGAHAQDFTIELDRYTKVEGSGTSVDITIQRTFAGPDADVFWRTVNGTALGGSDFAAVTSGSVHFNSSQTSQVISVNLVNDPTPEPNATTTLPDEYFFVELTGVSGPWSIQRGRTTVVIIDDDRTMPGVQFLSVVSGGTSTQGSSKIQWRVPAGQPSVPSQIQIRWDKGTSSCTFPNLVGEGIGGIILGAAQPGFTQSYSHDVAAPPHEVWCYSVFTLYSGTPTAEVAMVKTKTFDSAGPIKWTYTSSSLPNVAPPTIGQDGVYTVDNNGVLHAMQRFGAPGSWPGTWSPVMLDSSTANRSPVVPLGALGSRLFIGTQNGWVHSVDARTGTIYWSRRLMAGSVGAQATPALMLTGYGGAHDLVLVGTATGANNTKYFALDPKTGTQIDEYPNGTTDTPPGGLVENVYGMSVVDYTNRRVYVGTTGVDPTGFTLWSLDLGNPLPDLTLSSTVDVPWNPKPLGTGLGTNGSLVLRNGWLHFGTGTGLSTEGELHAIRLSDGVLRSYTHGDGQLKGFPWPDRRNGRLYFSTVNKLHAALFDGSSIGPDPGWVANLGGAGTVTLTNPSIPLQRPGTDELYIGDGNGRLYRFNAATGAQMGVLPLDAPGTIIGAPTLDTGTTPNVLLVGSDKGVVYAVQVGF